MAKEISRQKYGRNLKGRQLNKNMDPTTFTPSKELLAIIGLLAIILNHFHINIGGGEIQTLVGAVLVAYGVIREWYLKYKKGTLTRVGFYKK